MYNILTQACKCYLLVRQSIASKDHRLPIEIYERHPQLWKVSKPLLSKYIKFGSANTMPVPNHPTLLMKNLYRKVLEEDP